MRCKQENNELRGGDPMNLEAVVGLIDIPHWAMKQLTLTDTQHYF
jgi:hypothetical protein